MLMLAATGVLQRFGDMIVVGLVLALTAYGAHFGLFLAVLAGLHVLASLIIALAFSGPLASLLTAVELPDAYAFPAAFGLLFVGAAVAIRLTVGEVVPAEAVRFTPAIDKGAGGLVGALAGYVLAGAVLIALSIMPLPSALRIDGSKLRFDAGSKLLNTFARCVESDEAARELLVEGEPPVLKASADSTAASELFADGNGNDAYDDGEAYIDADENGVFTLQLPYVDSNGNGRRDVGLAEAYRLAAWRNAKVLHAPQIESPLTVDVAAGVNEGDVVYQIVAIDRDPDETITYGLRMDREPPAAGQAKGDGADDGGTSDYHDTDLLSIDKATGAVKMADPQGFFTRKPAKLRIVVTATDKHGLKAEKTVTLVRKAAKPDSGRGPKP